MEPSKEAPKFHQLLSGLSVMSRVFTRLGYDPQGFSLLIPPQFGAELEAEMLACDPEAWLPFCDGIEVHADGQLRQLVITQTIKIGWKTGPIRNRKKAASTCHPIPAGKIRQHQPRQ